MTTTPLTPATVTVEQVAKMIDHALLRPELTVGDIRRGCELAARYQVISVCVRPSDVPLAVELLAGTGVLVGTVIGFPHGSIATQVKAAETALAPMSDHELSNLLEWYVVHLTPVVQEFPPTYAEDRFERFRGVIQSWMFWSGVEFRRVMWETRPAWITSELREL